MISEKGKLLSFALAIRLYSLHTGELIIFGEKREQKTRIRKLWYLWFLVLLLLVNAK